MVTNRGSVILEAAEIRVGKHDSLTPAKLFKLADEGWTIIDAWKLKDGGVNYLVTRNSSTHKPEIEHLGTPRCPMYCNCEIT